MHRLIGAKTGWGKSCYGQGIMEANLREYPLGAVFDYKDEYRGLVKAGLAQHLIVGPREAGFSVSDWRAVFEEYPRLVLARYDLDEDEWADIVSTVSKAVRGMAQQAGGAFLAYEEAHFVAPQRGTVPSGTKGTATTGRGEKVSSLWLTQRLSELNETIIAQQDERLFGAFTSDADLDKIETYTEYDVDLHNPNRRPNAASVPDPLKVDGEAIPLRKFEEDGSTVGSEWVYSNDRGDVERRDTRGLTDRMDSTHYGPEGRPIHDP